VVGVGHSVYWLSWGIVGLFFSVASTLVLIFMGYICQFDVFLNIPFLMCFLLFFSFSLSMTALAFFVSTLVPT
jgi:hypothetical protein